MHCCWEPRPQPPMLCKFAQHMSTGFCYFDLHTTWAWLCVKLFLVSRLTFSITSHIHAALIPFDSHFTDNHAGSAYFEVAWNLMPPPKGRRFTLSLHIKNKYFNWKGPMHHGGNKHPSSTWYNSDAVGGSYLAVAPMDGGSAFALWFWFRWPRTCALPTGPVVDCVGISDVKLQDVGHRFSKFALRAEECGKCKGWQLGVIFWQSSNMFSFSIIKLRTFDFTLHLGHVRLCPECRDSVDKQCTYCTLEGMRSWGEIWQAQSPRTAKQCF